MSTQIQVRSRLQGYLGHVRRSVSIDKLSISTLTHVQGRINPIGLLSLGLLVSLLPAWYVVRNLLIRPAILSCYPSENQVGLTDTPALTVHFNKSIKPSSLNEKSVVLYDSSGHVVPLTLAYDAAQHTLHGRAKIALNAGETYRLRLRGGSAGAEDNVGHKLASDLNWPFTIGTKDTLQRDEGPGGPILLVTSTSNPFTHYYAEILRDEGFNEFATLDESQINAPRLTRFRIAIVGEVHLRPAVISTLSRWVHDGGVLIAMRPDRAMADAFGIRMAPDPIGSPLQPGGYLSISPQDPAGKGLIHEPIQFHGPVSFYSSRGASIIAALDHDGNTDSNYPAVIKLKVGSGSLIVFSYDLAKSIIFTRQGNPDWSGMERDGVSPIRSNDLFYGASLMDPQPDWVDTNKLEVPQADEQQRLLANLITLGTPGIPLPHFWYLPRGLKAAIVMTGDDHGTGGTVKRFNSYKRRSPSNCSLDDWECVRATSNVFVGSITSEQATRLYKDGFEIGLHVYTGCADWPQDQTARALSGGASKVDQVFANGLYRKQFAAFTAKYPGVPSPVSNRIDCVTWGDYDTQPKVELAHGIRFDTNYYFWPAKWVAHRIGLFTGSGMPMRFATRDGEMIDVYQAATQMTDESDQEYPKTIDTLLDNALGPKEFFGVFTANMHNDRPRSSGADAIIDAALKRHVPIVTASQMLHWLDGRNSSSFERLTWTGDTLGFDISVGVGGNGIQALVPLQFSGGTLAGITLNGQPLAYQERTITGIGFAAIPGVPGRIMATYRLTGK